MKRIIGLFSLLLLFVATSCNKLEEDRLIYEGQAMVEFDATVLNAAATGRTYPILTRVPGYGRPFVASIDPLITRTSGSIKFRVNLITAPYATDQTLTYRVVDTETSSSGTTTVTTAVNNVHYTTGTTFVIPAGSNFGEITVNILNPGPSATARDLVLEILGNDVVKPSPNYSKLGIRIAQN